MEQIRCTQAGTSFGWLATVEAFAWKTVARNWASSSGKLAMYVTLVALQYICILAARQLFGATVVLVVDYASNI